MSRRLSTYVSCRSFLSTFSESRARACSTLAAYALRAGTWFKIRLRPMCLGTGAGVLYAMAAPLLFPYVPEWGEGVQPFLLAPRELLLHPQTSPKGGHSGGAVQPVYYSYWWT